MPFWREDYFELKVINAQKIQEKVYTSPSTAYIYFGKAAASRKRAITRDSFLPKKLICKTAQTLFFKHNLFPVNGLSPLCIPKLLLSSLTQDVIYKP